MHAQGTAQRLKVEFGAHYTINARVPGGRASSQAHRRAAEALVAELYPRAVQSSRPVPSAN